MSHHLMQSVQDMPDDLGRIAHEVATGQRSVNCSVDGLLITGFHNARVQFRWSLLDLQCHTEAMCRVHDEKTLCSVRFHISMQCHFFMRLLYEMCRKYEHSVIGNSIWAEFVLGHGPLYGKAVSE